MPREGPTCEPFCNKRSVVVGICGIAQESRTIWLSSVCSGLGTAEMCWPFISSAFLKRKCKLKIRHHSACDISDACIAVLKQHKEQTRPEHMFGDLFKRVGCGALNVVVALGFEQN